MEHGHDTKRIALASVFGTTIEFYDFYVYGTAAALIIGPVFFPTGAAGSQTLNAFLTFGIAFLARPIGAFLFGHFGDRVGRKATLVASLLTMGISTTLIGILPGYGTAGWLAPVLLCLMRMGQGIGLGGEWGGAALLATENAPQNKRAWFGMFPQMGPPLGFIMANGLFLLLSHLQTRDDFLRWGWRIPFLVSAALVVVGLYVRVSLSETPAFARVQQHHDASRVPLLLMLRHHMGGVLLGALAMIMCYTLFYITTLFAIGYLTHTRGIDTPKVLSLLCVAVIGMAITTPISAIMADRWGRPAVLIGAAVLTIVIGLTLPHYLGATQLSTILLFLFVALAVMGLTFGPMGALLPEMFPTRVRYTACSTAYNLGGILGGSLTPYVAARLQSYGGLPWVGYYLSASAVISLISVTMIRDTGRDLTEYE